MASARSAAEDACVATPREHDTPENAPTPTSTSQAQRLSRLVSWSESFQRIREIQLQLRDADVRICTSIQELCNSVVLADPLVAFTAIQGVYDALIARIDTERGCNELVDWLLLQCCDASFSIRILRLLLRPRSDTDSDTEATASPLDISRCVFSRLLYRIGNVRRLIVGAVKSALKSPSDAHDGIMLLTDTTKLYYTLEEYGNATHVGDLCDTIEEVCATASTISFQEHEAPLFIACDVIDLVLESPAMFDTLPKESDVERQRWVTVAIGFIGLASNVSKLVVRMLGGSLDSDVVCSGAFVLHDSPYPLVQKWLLLGSLATSITVSGVRHGNKPLLDWKSWLASELSSAAIVRVLMEQDDIMVEVLLYLLSASSHRRLQEQRTSEMRDDLSPAELFAEFVTSLGQDHSVILDMLTSTETRMLEYIVQFLKEATSNWIPTRSCWLDSGRLESTMTVLIRLRCEIERLDDADVFPYNAKPLLRRLESLETLYES